VPKHVGVFICVKCFLLSACVRYVYTDSVLRTLRGLSPAQIQGLCMSVFFSLMPDSKTNSHTRLLAALFLPIAVRVTWSPGNRNL
jgi:hypothetical protein